MLVDSDTVLRQRGRNTAACVESGTSLVGNGMAVLGAPYNAQGMQFVNG